MSMIVSQVVTLDEVLIKQENSFLRWPWFGGITKVFAMLTDDHQRHIKSHLKFWYNPATWLHIHQHYMQLKLKRNMGIEHLTNDSIMEQVQAQQQEQLADRLIDQPDPKNPKVH